MLRRSPPLLLFFLAFFSTKNGLTFHYSPPFVRNVNDARFLYTRRVPVLHGSYISLIQRIQKTSHLDNYTPTLFNIKNSILCLCLVNAKGFLFCKLVKIMQQLAVYTAKQLKRMLHLTSHCSPSQEGLSLNHFARLRNIPTHMRCIMDEANVDRVKAR